MTRSWKAPAKAIVSTTAHVVTRAARVLSKAARRLEVAEADLVYERRVDDIIIASYPKSGTTWVQMILYQLTTDGEITFDHIDQVSPHFEETLLRRRRTISDLTPPRIVKTHLAYPAVPKGPGHYIYVVRDGRDVAVSFFHQLRHAFPDFHTFFCAFLQGRVPYGKWFTHVSGWVTNRKHLKLLIVRYEDLVRDLEGSVRTIAKFCSIALDQADIPRILHHCSFSFMKEHEARFSLSTRERPGAELPALVRRGRIGDWQEYLDEPLLRTYTEAFGASPLAATFADYRPLPPDVPLRLSQ